MGSKDVILGMLSDIKAHQRDKDDLLAYYVQERLNKSLQVYYKELLDSYNMLQRFDEIKKLRQFVKDKP